MSDRRDIHFQDSNLGDLIKRIDTQEGGRMDGHRHTHTECVSLSLSEEDGSFSRFVATHADIIPQDPHIKVKSWECGCHPKPGEMETGGPRAPLDSQCSWTSEP